MLVEMVIFPFVFFLFYFFFQIQILLHQNQTGYDKNCLLSNPDGGMFSQNCFLFHSYYYTELIMCLYYLYTVYGYPST